MLINNSTVSIVLMQRPGLNPLFEKKSQLVAGAASLAAAEESSADGRNVEPSLGSELRCRLATEPARGTGKGAGVRREDGGGGAARE